MVKLALRGQAVPLEGLLCHGLLKLADPGLPLVLFLDIKEGSASIMAASLPLRLLSIGLRTLEDKVPVLELELMRSGEVRGTDHLKTALERPVPCSTHH